MARKKSSDEKTAETEVVTSAPEPKPKAAEPKPVAKPTATTNVPVVETASKKEPTMTFDRFFTTTGKPAHHKGGMAAWLKKRGGLYSRRTLASWRELFANY